MLSKFKLNQLYFQGHTVCQPHDTAHFHVLLIANPYDAFMLEDDGRIDERIFNEYTSLSLRYPPPFHAGFHLRGGADTAVLHLFSTSSSACRARETTTASTWHDTSKPV